MVKVFLVKGKFLMGERMQPFSKECRATNKEAAVEFILSDLGSRHKTPRNKIDILTVKEVEAENTED